MATDTSPGDTRGKLQGAVLDAHRQCLAANARLKGGSIPASHDWEVTACDRTTHMPSAGRCARCGKEWNDIMSPLQLVMAGSGMCRGRSHRADCCDDYFATDGHTMDCPDRWTPILWFDPDQWCDLRCLTRRYEGRKPYVE